MTSRAILLVTMEPPSTLEEEFNDWYDFEHFPQRAAMPGFESASRWVCVDGWPRWLALYDLASTSALESDAYLAASGPRSTPWSRRILPRMIGRSRIVAEAVGVQDALQFAPGQAGRLVWAAFTAASRDEVSTILRAVRAAWSPHPDLRQLRSFVTVDRNSSTQRLCVFATFASAVQATTLHMLLGGPAGHAPSTFNVYAPYWRNT